MRIELDIVLLYIRDSYVESDVNGKEFFQMAP